MHGHGEGIVQFKDLLIENALAAFEKFRVEFDLLTSH